MKSTSRPRPKKISKHKKKGWKTIDTQAIEDYLDERSFEERTGGILANKSDSELFFIDKTTTTDGEKPNRRNRKLRCHSLLEPDPRFKPINSGSCTKSRNLKRLHPEIKKRINSKEEAEFEAQLNKYHTQHKTRFNARLKLNTEPQQNYDLWADNSSKVVTTEDDPIVDVKVKKPVKPPNHHKKKPSSLKPISKPHPGTSYNPAYDEHQNLLRKALKVELKKKKIEEEIENNTISKKIEIQEPEKKNKDKKLPVEEEEEEINDEDLDSTGINPAVRREDRKSQKHKDHDRKVKLQARKKNALKAIRIRESEVFRIKTFNKEFKAKDKLTEVRKKKKEKLKTRKKFETKRLGHAKFEEAEIELKLGREITGSLRTLKPEGNVLTDRYKSLQKRNIIAAPAKIQKRKLGHVKFYEKRGHKEISEQYGFK